MVLALSKSIELVRRHSFLCRKLFPVASNHFLITPTVLGPIIFGDECTRFCRALSVGVTFLDAASVGTADFLEAIPYTID